MPAEASGAGQMKLTCLRRYCSSFYERKIKTCSQF